MEDPNRNEYILKFIECLCVCHSVISEEKLILGKKSKVYNASSADELALLNAMRHFGYMFVEKDE
jgi:magnesium-transporting ATPase (P-type)